MRFGGLGDPVFVEWVRVIDPSQIRWRAPAQPPLGMKTGRLTPIYRAKRARSEVDVDWTAMWRLDYRPYG